MRSLAREFRRFAIVTLAALGLACGLWLWLAGLEALPSVMRNLPYGLVLSGTITGLAGLLCNLAIMAGRSRPAWVRWSGCGLACIGAAVAGAYLTAVIFHLGGLFPRSAVAVNFQENVRGAVLVTLSVGGIIMGLREWRNTFEVVSLAVGTNRAKNPRVASRVGGKVEFVDLSAVTYVYAQDKLTFAVTPAKHHPLDLSLAELEQKVAFGDWIRIHRSSLVKVSAVRGLYTDVMGRLFVRLSDGAELRVAKERAAQVRAALKG